MHRFNSLKLGLLAALASRLDAQMVAGTGIAGADRPGGHQYAGTFTLDPASIAAGGREVETVAIPGVQVGDIVVVAPRAATSLIIGYVRVSGPGAIEFALENNTIGAVDQASGVWDYKVLRGTSGPLR